VWSLPATSPAVAVATGPASGAAGTATRVGPYSGCKINAPLMMLTGSSTIWHCHRGSNTIFHVCVAKRNFHCHFPCNEISSKSSWRRRSRSLQKSASCWWSYLWSLFDLHRTVNCGRYFVANCGWQLSPPNWACHNLVYF